MTNKSAQRRGGRGGAAYLEGILETVGDVAGGGADHDGASLDGLCDGKGGSRQSRGRRGDGDQHADWGLVAAVRRWSQKKRPRRLTFAATAERATRALEAETRATGATTRRADMVAAILMLSAADYAIRAEHCGWHRGSDLPVTEPSPASGWVGFSDKLSSPAHSCVTFPTVVLRLSWTTN